MWDIVWVTDTVGPHGPDLFAIQQGGTRHAILFSWAVLEAIKNKYVYKYIYIYIYCFSNQDLFPARNPNNGPEMVGIGGPGSLNEQPNGRTDN